MQTFLKRNIQRHRAASLRQHGLFSNVYVSVILLFSFLLIAKMVTSRCATHFLFCLLLLFTCQHLQQLFRILASLYCDIRVVVALHDGSETENEIGEREAQQKRDKSWKCSEIARKPYVVAVFFCESFKKRYNDQST